MTTVFVNKLDKSQLGQLSGMGTGNAVVYPGQLWNVPEVEWMLLVVGVTPDVNILGMPVVLIPNPNLTSVASDVILNPAGFGSVAVLTSLLVLTTYDVTQSDLLGEISEDEYTAIVTGVQNTPKCCDGEEHPSRLKIRQELILKGENNE